MSKSTPKSTSKTGASSAATEPEFVLKHRIAGAAFLLFFGALVLPWVLGAPGQDATQIDAQAANSRPGDNGSSNADLQEALSAEQIDVEEQVYISKITPLDAQASKADSAPGEAVTPASAKPASSAAIVKEEGDKPAVTPATTPAKTPAQAGQGKTQSGASPKAAPPTQVAKAKPVEQAPTLNKTQPEPAQTKPVVQAPAIEVGWVVQVGVFTDKRGANKVVADLRSKGFKPSTTIVDTNRGKASGTRIWLGPFAQRVEAAKAKSELTQKTGEAGFIRAYP